MVRVLALLFLTLAATLVQAAPARYQLDTEGSTVSFTYRLEGTKIRGQMPVQSADMLIDLDNLAASSVTVALNAAAARAGFIFATDAMRGTKVLDTRNHPLIHFRSTSVRGRLEGAIVTGELTIRGVTRPVELRAALFQQEEIEPTDTDKLTVLLVGSVSRKAFGASGFPNMVGDQIDLRIIAQIEN